MTVHPEYNLLLDTVVCEGGFPLQWEGFTIGLTDELAAAGDSTLLFQRSTVAGCDSLATLQLTLSFNDSSTVYDTVYQRQLPYSYGDSVFTIESFADSDAVALTVVRRTAAGCDSVVDYHLLLLTNILVEVDSTVCESQLPVAWNGAALGGQWSAGSGQLVDTAVLTAASGVDSVVVMRLNVLPTLFDTIMDTIVENLLPYTFLHHTYQGDTVGDTLVLVSSTGCDSVLAYSLTVHRNVDTMVYDTVCSDGLHDIVDGGQWSVDGGGVDSTGTSATHYTLSATHLNIYGADSVVVMQLTVHPSYAIADTLAVCESLLPYAWSDTTLADDGDYSRSFTTAEGCDSVESIAFAVLPTVYDTLLDTIVENMLPYTFLHHTYQGDTVGDTLVLVSSTGCDSVLAYSLTVHRNVDTMVYDTVCSDGLHDIVDGGQWSVDGGGVDSTGTSATHYTLSATHLNIYGADSVVVMQLTVHPSYTLADTLAVCESLLPYAWSDTTLADEGDYSRSFTTAEGCDSVESIAFAVLPTVYDTLLDTIVENLLPYTFLHHTYQGDTVGDTLVLVSSTGCDSVLAFSLTVHRNVDTVVYDTVCSDEVHDIVDGGQWSVDGGGVDSTGTGATHYTLSATHLNIYGADSVVVMQLTVHPSYALADTGEVCRDRLPYSWRDTLIDNTESAFITVAYRTAQGCDSIHTLDLTVKPSYMVHDDADICSNLLPYSWRDTVVSTFGDFAIHRTTAAGCDSVLTLSLAIRSAAASTLADTFCTGTTYLFDGSEIVAGGTYLDSLLTEEGCDSVVTLNLVELPLPQVGIDADIDCAEQLYLLHAIADVPYIEWNAEGVDWDYSWGDRHGTDLHVSTIDPQFTSLTITLFADYHDRPTCYSTTELALPKIAVPEAVVAVRPPFATRERNELLFTEEGDGEANYSWYVDGRFIGEGHSAGYTMPADLDSVVVMLVAEGATCTDTAYDTVYMHYDNIFVPNVFTPDLESNNLFTVVMKGIVEYELYVYNRNGELIYHSTDMESAWDGTDLHGNACQQGAYVYLIRYRDSTAPLRLHTIKGSVLLLR